MRHPRQIVPGARYHVSARINRREFLLEDPAEKAHFLGILARAQERFQFRLESYCILSNHFHLVLRPRDGSNLSRILQWVLSVFAMGWNRRHGQTGHVWGERFFSKVLATLTEYLHTLAYIDANPVRAGLVLCPQDWPFSSRHPLARGRPPIVSLPVGVD